MFLVTSELTKACGQAVIIKQLSECNPRLPPHEVCRGQHRGFSCISHRFVPQGRGIKLAHFQSQGDSKKHTNNSYSEAPHGRGTSKNELLIPFKSPPLPVRGVVGTDIDRCIIHKLSVPLFCLNISCTIRTFPERIPKTGC